MDITQSQIPSQTIVLPNYTKYFKPSDIEILPFIVFGAEITLSEIIKASTLKLESIDQLLLGLGILLPSTAYTLITAKKSDKLQEMRETLNISNVLSNYNISSQDMENADLERLKMKMPLLAEYINDNYLPEDVQVTAKECRQDVQTAINSFVSREKNINFKSEIVIQPSLLYGQFIESLGQTWNDRIYIKTGSSIFTAHTLAHEHFHYLGIVDPVNNIGEECIVDIAAARALIESGNKHLKQSSLITTYSRLNDVLDQEYLLRKEIRDNFNHTIDSSKSPIKNIYKHLLKRFFKKAYQTLETKHENEIFETYSNPVTQWIAAYEYKHNKDFFEIK